MITSPQDGDLPPAGDPPTGGLPPDEKLKCNVGGGNGSEGDEDCDPGKSGGRNKGGD